MCTIRYAGNKGSRSRAAALGLRDRMEGRIQHISAYYHEKAEWRHGASQTPSSVLMLWGIHFQAAGAPLKFILDAVLAGTRQVLAQQDILDIDRPVGN